MKVTVIKFILLASPNSAIPTKPHSSQAVAMNFNLFKPKQKTPPELVRNAKDAVHRLDTSDKRKVGVPVPGNDSASGTRTHCQSLTNIAGE